MLRKAFACTLFNLDSQAPELVRASQLPKRSMARVAGTDSTDKEYIDMRNGTEGKRGRQQRAIERLNDEIRPYEQRIAGLEQNLREAETGRISLGINAKDNISCEINYLKREKAVLERRVESIRRNLK